MSSVQVDLGPNAAEYMSAIFSHKRFSHVNGHVLISDGLTPSFASQPQVSLPLDGLEVQLNILSTYWFLVMLYYEYLLTLSREIQFLWPPHNKLGWFTFVCLLNRYLPLFGQIPVFLPYLIAASSNVRRLSWFEVSPTWTLTEYSCKPPQCAHSDAQILTWIPIRL